MHGIRDLFFGFLVLSSLCTGCGDSEKESQSSETQSKDVSPNASKAADTAQNSKSPSEANSRSSSFSPASGTYSFLTKEIPFVCSDQGRGTIKSLSMNLDVQIEKNIIKIFSSNDGTTNNSVVIKVEKTNGYSGLIEKDGSFSVHQDGTSNTIYGYAGFNNYISGKFEKDGKWDGEYKYDFTIFSSNLLCEYSTTFTGSLH